MRLFTVYMVLFFCFVPFAFSQNNTTHKQRYEKRQFGEDFVKKHFGVSVEDYGYAAIEYWKEKGSEKVSEKDISKPTSKSFVKVINVEDIDKIIPGIIKLAYKTDNSEIVNIQAVMEGETGQVIIDELYDMGIEYSPSQKISKTMSFKGSYLFKDVSITVYDNYAKDYLIFSVTFSKEKTMERKKKLRTY